jgi:hypothetical protein
MPSQLPNWQKRLKQMQDCASVAELLAQHGEPHHKVPQDGFEIWHYPLGIEQGMVYSIHVPVWPNGQRQTYLYFEPTSDNVSIRRRPWWQFWKK